MLLMKCLLVLDDLLVLSAERETTQNVLQHAASSPSPTTIICTISPDVGPVSMSKSQMWVIIWLITAVWLWPAVPVNAAVMRLKLIRTLRERKQDLLEVSLVINGSQR